jgi:transcription initiation factor TFIIIB Brf1 subunit/transcription initiation factor TFIIB
VPTQLREAKKERKRKEEEAMRNAKKQERQRKEEAAEKAHEAALAAIAEAPDDALLIGAVATTAFAVQM